MKHPEQNTRRLFFPTLNTAVLFTLLAALSPVETQGQQINVGDPLETYMRLLSSDMDQTIAPSFHLRPLTVYPAQIESLARSHPWQDRLLFRGQFSAPGDVDLRDWRNWKLDYRIAGPAATYTWNNKFAFGQNDGAMWQGKGNNYLLSTGARIQYGPFQATVRPEFIHSQNHEFDLAPMPPHLYWPFSTTEWAQHFARIDMPQRFGDEEISWVHPGQSTVSFHYRGGVAGVSTANNWIGPAIYNPLLMSNNAPGFFHAFIGTDRPIDTPAGNFEGRIFWGNLRESDFFRQDTEKSLRYISGLTLSWSPVFLPDLYVGMSRVFVEHFPDDGMTFGHLTRPFQAFTQERFEDVRPIRFAWENEPRMRSVDTAMHLISFFMRWVVPEHNFELWAEWGKNENTNDRRNFLTEPVHTRSYVLGFLKRFNIDDRRWIISTLELTQIENLEDTQTVDYPVWYEHLYISQGYTNRGQVIGAGIGPGSNSQKLRLDYYERRGLFGLSINRVVHHNDRLYRHQSHITRNQERILQPHWNHDVPQYASAHDITEVEFRYGIHGLLFLPWNLEFQADIYRSNFLNRYNIFNNDISKTNVQFTLRYQLPGMIR